MDRISEARSLTGATCLAVLSGVLWLASADPCRAQPTPPATSRTAPEPGVAQPVADDAAAADPLAALAPRYRQWIVSVSGLITRAELDYFVGLGHDYQRDAFMEAFWEPRDPEPLTRRNELRERWEQAIFEGGGPPGGDPRFMLYLLNGPPGAYSLPDGRPAARCFSRSFELEIWFYGGSERTNKRFLVIFYRPGGTAPYRTYLPGDPIRPVPRVGRLPTTDIQSLCADELLRYAALEISRISGYGRLIEEVLTPPSPSAEWLANLALGGTQLPADAETLELAADVDFPARRQSRTAVRVLLRVPTSEAPGRSFDDRLFHHFEVVGEVIRDDRLFETLRYRFEGATPEGVDEIPLGFTRYLRPGPVTLRILLQDVFSGRFAQVVRELEIPSPADLPEDPGETLLSRLSRPPPGAGEGRSSLRLNAPRGSALAGPVRFTARADGELDKVTFYLDDRPVFTLRRPPWSAEFNLGPSPAPHRVRVVGFVGDQEVATDQVWLNQGALRFRVRLVEPRSGGIYPGSLTARIEVETPDGQPPERVELWLDEERVAILREPPLARTLDLGGPEPAVVRAVAYLADGSSAEDAVLVNAAGLTETVEVRLVELPVLVVDERGEPILDLTPGEFRLYDDGQQQQLQRVLGPGEFPLRAALLIDRSASMQPQIGRVTEAAARFVDAALTSTGDRLAILSFADRLALDAGFTDNRADLERALAGLVARGATTLYDSLAQALASFDEAPGQKALILFSDGRDEGSTLDLEAAIDAARRGRATIFAIGLEQAFADRRARREIERLATETGGQAWFLGALDELPGVYRAILDQLRARYLLAYSAPSAGPATGPRSVRVEVERKGARARVQDGYYP